MTKRIIAAALLVGIAAITLTACQSRPPLKQVSADLPEKSINTPEAAARLKQKYEK